ncbi:hypothetical protein QBC45DRAFT_334775 [Copromyces sp. CBS 386.78]|nr:hypothetical protein QBC45DRAFT_334775 [Copromyces sp. CBS 386.78]
MRDEARLVHMRKKPMEVGVGVDLALSCLRGVRMGDGAKRGNRQTRAETLIEQSRERKGEN